MRAKPADAAIICNGDLHSGSSLALWHPDMLLPKGGMYRNKVTDWLWGVRQETVVWAHTLTKKRRRIIVHNGDLVQGIVDPFSEMITNLSEYQAANAALIIADEALPSDRMILIRGTPRHDGPEGSAVEAIGKTLKIPDVNGERSRYAVTLLVNGVRIHVTHHIGTSRSPVSKTTGLMSSLAMIDTEYARWGKAVPDILVRAHRHEYGYIHLGGKGQGQAVITTPAWCAKGEYAVKVSPNTIAHVGIVVILIDGDGAWHVEPHYTAIEDDDEVTV